MSRDNPGSRALAPLHRTHGAPPRCLDDDVAVATEAAGGVERPHELVKRVIRALGGRAPPKPSSILSKRRYVGDRMSIAFLVTTLVVVATPGTGAVYTIAAGLAHGRRPSLIAAFGCTLGVVPHMVAAITGLAALLNASAVAFQAVKWLGVAYLLFLAWQTVRDKSAIDVEQASAPGSPWRVIRTAVLINLLNPKLTIFFFAFLPQFVPAGTSNAWLRMIGLSIAFMGVTFAVFAVYGVFAATMRRQVLGRPTVVSWLRRTFAFTYVALAGRLAVQSR